MSKKDLVEEEFGAVEVKEPKKRRLAKEEYTKVEIEIPVDLKVNGVRYQRGKHIVEKHLSRDMVPMCQAKMSADLHALAVDSKSYLVNRAIDGSINVKQVGEIKLK